MIQQPKIRIKLLRSSSTKPTRATSEASGYDLYTDLDNVVLGKMNGNFNFYHWVFAEDHESILIKPNGRVLVPSGIAIALPQASEGFLYEAEITPRSGMALKSGITVLNTPGTIDADYRGEIGVILYNTSPYEIKISKGDRVAQMKIGLRYVPELIEVDDLDVTDRNEGGFGHSGN